MGVGGLVLGFRLRSCVGDGVFSIGVFEGFWGWALCFFSILCNVWVLGFGLVIGLDR